MPEPTDPAFAALLLDSYACFLNRPLVDLAAGERTDAAWLYDAAPFCLLAHDTAADPLFTYANRTAQARFGHGWDEMIGLPSRLSAEAPERDERELLLKAVACDGFIADYRGVRVAKSGRRFRVWDAVIWELIDREGVRHGQAAVLRSWSDL